MSSKENVQFKVDLHDPSGLSAISYKSVQLRAGATRKVLMRKVLLSESPKSPLNFRPILSESQLIRDIFTSFLLPPFPIEWYTGRLNLT